MDAAVLTSMRHEGPCDDDGITAGLLSASRAERWRRMADEANHGPIKEGYYAALLSRTDVVVVASVSCIYGLGVPELYESSAMPLRVGESVGPLESGGVHVG